MRDAIVLVVDDDQLNRIVLSKLLEHEGYQAHAVCDGAAALEALEGGRFDAILLDIMMPGIDGIAVLQTIKTSSQFWRMPVIMISAVEETASIVRCLELGAEDYVLKPFDPVLLRARINACLARRRFQDIEGEYHKLVEEQAIELDRLYRLGRFFPATVAKRALAGQPDVLTAPHRAEVAVMSCALDGFGALAEVLEPAEALRELAPFHALVRDLVGSFEATVNFSDAHSVSVFFNDPLPCDRPGLQALRMASRFTEEAASLVADWSNRFGPHVDYGAAVASGVAVIGPVGLEPAVDYAAVGPVVDRAGRLCRGSIGHHQVVCDQASLDEAGEGVESYEVAPAEGFRVVMSGS